MVRGDVFNFVLLEPTLQNEHRCRRLTRLSMILVDLKRRHCSTLRMISPCRVRHA